MEVRKRKNADGGASVNAGDDGTPSSVSSTSDRTVRSKRRIFLLCLAFRVVNALLIQTYFNPDEHWLSLEVAHHGDGNGWFFALVIGGDDTAVTEGEETGELEERDGVAL
ncbi:hypothetical protein F2Q70_00007434 [Brassica cretica]|uniref:Mannosyltransferase n=1 Tax=Brassica cretica TaxID=69181 RepID=A0A8S9LX40_BRACR|nr:hypothetical protein F2Q70_00007434 [Brassica cretica]